jgi:PST family polysaccharide transporter
MSDLRDKTLSGLKWSGATHLACQALQFAISVIVARALSPQEFGLMGMVAVFSGLAGVFNGLGLGTALVQKQKLEERHLSTIFWVNVACGASMTAGFAAAAPAISNFYGEPTLRALTLATGLTFILGSLGIVHRNIMIRAMDFRGLFIIETTAVVVAGVVAVAGAVTGWGVWSLVAQSLVFTAVYTLMLWRLSTWRPVLSVDGAAVRELWGFSSNLLGYNVLKFSDRNLDNLLIGRFIGPGALGIYARAYGLMLLPIDQVSTVLTRVMFPALSVLQGDLDSVKRIYLRATRAIALVSFPMMLGLLVVADPLILTMYGEKWRGAVPLIQIFCLTGLSQSIGTTVGWIYNSLGRTDIQLQWAVFTFVVRSISFVIGLKWGVFGVTVAYVASDYVLFYPSWVIPGRLIGMNVGEIVGNVAKTFLCAATMAAAVWLLGLLLPPQWPSWALLAAQVPAGVISYLGLIHFLQVEAYLELRALAAEQLQSRPYAPAGVAL